MSRSLLAQGSRHLPPWLIFDVRHSNHNMRQVTSMCATGSRCASAHLLRPAGDKKRKDRGLLTGAKVERLASAVRFASLSRPASGCDAQPSLIAYRRYIESPPTASGYGPHATPIPVRLGRSANSRMVPAINPTPKTNQSPNKAMELTRTLVTNRAAHAPRQVTSAGWSSRSRPTFFQGRPLPAGSSPSCVRTRCERRSGSA